MKKNAWKKRIIGACEKAGTYKDAFDDTIETLAIVLEKRDDILKACKGADPVISHTNSHGETNTAKNPLLQLLFDYNNQALAYWRDLGLTAKGLKAINESALKGKKADPMNQFISAISHDIGRDST